MEPLVSIIIPTYNRAHLIGGTLDSVMMQTYSNWECIIVDDGSMDTTSELIDFYRQKDSRIQYFLRPNERPKGANACRNYGFELSKGDYLQWLDSDDLMSPEKIENQIKSLLNSNIELTFCRWASFKNNVGQIVLEGKVDLLSSCRNPEKLFDYFASNNDFLPAHAYLMKRAQMIKAGGWNEYLKVNQDGEFFSRVLLLCNSIGYSKGCLVYYRRRAGNNNTSIYNSQEKVDDGVLSWKLIEQIYKIRYKTDIVPYVEYAKRLLFYSIRSAGDIEFTFKHSEFFHKELEKWNMEEKERKTFSRKLNRVKRFIEKRIFKIS